MSSAAPPPASTHLPPRVAWAILLALASGFTLSQSFRTVAAIMGPPLAGELHLSPQQLGLWAAAYHFSFGIMQLVMGVSIDLFGIRRTILAAFPMAVLGAAVSAVAPNYTVLLLGQMLIGTGCAPAFLVCTVFIAKYFAPQRFTATSGLIMSISGLGVLATATPLAWLIEVSHWRWGFGVLAIASAAAWVAMWWLVRAPRGMGTTEPAAERQSVGAAMRDLLRLFALPHTAGLVAYAAVAYAGFITLRGLWLGVLLAIAYGALSGYGLLQYGYVRDAYPEHVRGRALSLFTMAMFLGIALMQWASGLVASVAARWGVEPFTAALLTMGAMLLLGALAFWKLPRNSTP